MSRLICIAALDGSFPFATSTLYEGHCTRRYPWLSRVGPDGHRGRHLWLDVDAFNRWAQARGLSYRLRLAAESEARQ